LKEQLVSDGLGFMDTVKCVEDYVVDVRNIDNGVVDIKNC
jgi:hypothetical protein